MTETNNQPPLDELTKTVIDFARTGVYAAVGLTDKLVHQVNEEIRRQQEEARARRAKRAEQAEDLKDRAKHLPEEVKGWPEQVREGVETFLIDARNAMEDLADHGRETVSRFQRRSDVTGTEADAEQPAETPADEAPTVSEAPGVGFAADPVTEDTPVAEPTVDEASDEETPSA